MRRLAQRQKEVSVRDAPDNTVFWSIVAIISIFVVVLAIVMVVRTGMTGQIVYVWENPGWPSARNQYACMDMPPCGSDTSFLCCAENPLPGTSIKCIHPLNGFGVIGAGNPLCPVDIPYACTCPEKFQYRQTWPVPIVRRTSYG